MKYLLSQTEMNNLVDKTELLNAEKKIVLLIKKLKTHIVCWNEKGGYCDDCPISSLNTNTKTCESESYSSNIIKNEQTR